MKPHRTGILFSVLYLLLTTAYIIPNNVNFIYWSIRLKAFARIVNGAVEFLVFVVWSFWGGDTPLKMFIGVLILGLISRLFVYNLWKANKLRPDILFFCVLFNSAFGLLAVINSGMVVEQPFSSCEQTLSASTQVQVIVFPETGVTPGAYYFFVNSHDGGKSWNQIFELYKPEKIEVPCQNLHISSEQGLIWFWLGTHFAVSQDQGESWDVWNPSETWPNWICCQSGLILDVRFETAQTGIMDIIPPPNLSQTQQLISQDSGKTWKEP